MRFANLYILFVFFFTFLKVSQLFFEFLFNQVLLTSLVYISIIFYSITVASLLIFLPGLSLHHPRWAPVPGNWSVPVASRGADAESASPYQGRPHIAHSRHDGEPLPRDGPRYALHAGTHSLPARDRCGVTLTMSRALQWTLVCLRIQRSNNIGTLWLCISKCRTVELHRLIQSCRKGLYITLW